MTDELQGHDSRVSKPDQAFTIPRNSLALAFVRVQDQAYIDPIDTSLKRTLSM
jgi:hypothetical protein